MKEPAEHPLDIEPPFDKDEVMNNLPVTVAIVVPSTRDEDIRIQQGAFETRIEYMEKLFDDWFGGDTTIRAEGGYVQEETGERIAEDVAIVESSTTVEKYRKIKDRLKDEIEERQENWSQDTIAFRIGERTYIYPKKDYIDDEDRAKMDVLIG